MAESKKKAEPKKTIIDVTHPDEVKPSDTAKPVIVGHKPILKDPMVIEDVPDESPPDKPITKTGEIKIKPLSETDSPEDDAAKDKPAEEKPDQKKTIAELAAAAEPEEPKVEPAAAPEAEPPEPAEDAKPAEVPEEKPPAPAGTGAEGEPEESKPGDEQKQPADPAKEEQIKAEAAAKHDAHIQELADSKKFFLPINAVEKRRSKRVAIAGVVLSVILALAWVDIALDAGLIEIGGIEPVTHFFSN